MNKITFTLLFDSDRMKVLSPASGWPYWETSGTPLLGAARMIGAYMHVQLGVRHQGEAKAGPFGGIDTQNRTGLNKVLRTRSM